MLTILAFGCVLVAGCSVSPGNRLTLFPQGHRLMDAARDISSTYTEPLPIPRELDKRVLGPYVVEPGDVLLTLPAKLDSPVRLPGDQPVLPDGTIDLGLYGRIVVAGLTLDAIETAVNAAVKAKTPDAGPVNVRLISRQSKVYYVLGEVNAPGAFPLSGRETVLDGILAAGGLNERASRRDIILSRPTGPNECRIVLPVCYPEIVQLGDTTTNYQLAPGDRIYVATRSHEGGMFSHKKKVCPACCRPQVGCPAPGGAPTCPAAPAELSVTHRGACPEALRPDASGPAPVQPVVISNPSCSPAMPSGSEAARGQELTWRRAIGQVGN
jgi:protein involved in polysaccharide export with SLBB domain